MNRALRRLDQIHSKLLTTVAPVGDNVFSRKPSDHEWSVAEIVHHLCLVETRVTKDLEKGLARPPVRIGILGRLKPTSIVAVRLLRVRAPGAMNPINPPSKEESLANYDAARNRLKELCSTHGWPRLKQVVFKHPFLGDINGTATVSFVGYHELRHFKQIKEVLRKLN